MLMDMNRRARRGFTLIEILVVVVMLGILAAIVIPQFSDASDTARETGLKQDLFRVRQQVEIYRNQHDGDYPLFAEFEDQMTQASNLNGQTAVIGTPGYALGPYLPYIPKNPFTVGETVGEGAVGTSDWYYDESSGHFAANDSAEHRTW